MKKTKVGLLFLMALLGGAPLAAQANRDWHGDILRFDAHDMRRWRSGRWMHGSHGNRQGWWWVVGGLWYFYPGPIYPYPDPYRPPVLEEPAAPVMVAPQTEMPAEAAAPAVVKPQAPQYWYYCEPAKAYYPYAQTCPMPWKAVPATPTGVAR
ncbi:hypothetical protein [Rhodoferax sp.]|uniref:hypothetical protein n=1 Tax=Rhodoferax sp. TaxID=50421 RepID=UPI0028476144|nr:hypothetical protein [Rhodoferax sp.]MDR3371330.1 hypothetical protein [Rhodoferax sp.]